MVSYGEKKAMIQQLLDDNGFDAILIREITNPKGRFGVPKKYAGQKAIVIVMSPQETKGRGSK